MDYTTRDRLLRLGLVHSADQLEQKVTAVVKDPVSPHQFLDSVLDADEGQLRQVFSNLLKNAVEAMSGRGSLTVRIDPAGGFEVEDDGPGLPDDPERIFEPEFTTRSSGTGLGLAIVRRIVEDHGGSIEAVPSPRGGARIRVAWPGSTEGASDD